MRRRQGTFSKEKQMGIFIEDKDTIDVKVFILDTGDNIYADTDKKVLLKRLKEEKVEGDCTEHVFKIGRMNYRVNVEVTKKSVTMNGEDISVDPSTYRYERFVSLVRDWTFKDAKGKKVPVNRSNIDKLNPEVANAVLVKLDSIL